MILLPRPFLCCRFPTAKTEESDGEILVMHIASTPSIFFLEVKHPTQMLKALCTVHNCPCVTWKPRVSAFWSVHADDCLGLNRTNRDGLMNDTVLVNVGPCSSFCSKDSKHFIHG